ncbi:hypothetical protein A8M77_21910 [Variovorax sp. JS1663]|nr:hypothetical protein A8M77_21910 [Variovorax sp. JS1663]
MRAVIEELIAYRSHLAAAVPYFAPTDIGSLTPAKQLSETRLKEENDYGNRVRAAIQMSLAAAAASLRLTESLMRDDAQLGLPERQQNLARCAQDAQACRDVSGHVVALLSGKEAPKVDALMEIRRLKAAIHDRFGQWPGSR